MLKRFAGALSIPHVDAASCNGCELEINALGNSYYNLEGLGIHFVASPRHADMLLVTGPVSKNMEVALKRTYDATPEPKLVVAIGECGCTGGVFGESYASCGRVSNVIPVDVAVPGCPRYAVGSWSPVYTLPIVPIQVVLLTDGKLLMWDSVGDKPAQPYTWHNSTRAAILDPLSLDVARVDNSGWKGTGYNIFCSGFAHLPDGIPFIAGGNRNSSLEGLNVTHYFKHSDNTWQRGRNMREGDRWYPSVTPLANGEKLITSGGPGTPEVLSTSLTLRSPFDAEWYMGLYPWLQAAPNGDAFYFGPGNEISYIDTQGTGSMTPVKSRDSLVRSYGSYAMYDIGKIVASGGGQSSKTTVFRLRMISWIAPRKVSRR